MEEKIIYEKTENDYKVPRENNVNGIKIYDTLLPMFLLGGFFAGGIITGVIAWLVASGVWPITGFGYFSASGESPAVLTGFAFGSAMGSLAAGLVWIYRNYRIIKKEKIMDQR